MSFLANARIPCATACALVSAAAAAAAAGGETALLLPSDPGVADQFGSAVALEGGLAVVGAVFDDAPGQDSGSAYVFDLATGLQTAKLLPGDGAPHDLFGRSVAIGGGVVAVGAPFDAQRAGSVYLFDAASGAQRARLVGHDTVRDDNFGTAVALDGGLLAVGAWQDEVQDLRLGSVYVFDVATGQQLYKLLPSDADDGAAFGRSVAMQGGRLLVGAPGVGDGVALCGAAYVFDAATGRRLAELVPADGDCFEPFGRRFGDAVGLDGDLAVVGAPYDDPSGPYSGSAYVFDLATGQQLHKLSPDDGAESQSFGGSVALSGATVLVGANGDAQNGPAAGAAYLFDALTGAQIAKLLPSDAAELDTLGFAVALEGDTALVGAPIATRMGVTSGCAYTFDAGAAIAVPYCFGAGAGAACPCANAGAALHGCGNSVFAEGARLSGAGSPCVGADGLSLRVAASRPDQPGLFFQGDDAVNGGLGAPFGDGLRCAAGGELRLEVAAADAAGAAASTVPIAATAGLAAGDVRRYQWWYRDPGASPCGSGFNLSNGLEVVWGP